MCDNGIVIMIMYFLKRLFFFTDVLSDIYIEIFIVKMIYFIFVLKNRVEVGG